MIVHHCPADDYCYHPRPSQMRILNLVVRGLPSRQIAVRLGLAPSTVKNNLSLLYKAFGCCDRLTLSLKAAKAGLIDIDELVAEA